MSLYNKLYTDVIAREPATEAISTTTHVIASLRSDLDYHPCHPEGDPTEGF